MATFPNTTIYTLTHNGFTYFYFYLDGAQTSLTEIEFTRLANAGAKIVVVEAA